MSISTNAAGAVVFDYAAWSALFSELAANLTQDQAQAYFDQAGSVFLRNDAASPVRNLITRAHLLNLLTAHIAVLNLPESVGGSGPGNVARIASATQGSVSIKSEYPLSEAKASWFCQTQYGAMFWQATAQFRTMRLLPGRATPARIWP